MALNAAAIARITATYNPLTNTKLTVEQYNTHYYPKTQQWHGDSCGCTDDRCQGFHHPEGNTCGCLNVQLDELHLVLTQ